MLSGARPASARIGDEAIDLASHSPVRRHTDLPGLDRQTEGEIVNRSGKTANADAMKAAIPASMRQPNFKPISDAAVDLKCATMRQNAAGALPTTGAFPKMGIFASLCILILKRVSIPDAAI
jgi:hypothetical protein